MREGDGTKTAYFRGRRLQGRDVKVPGGYTGMRAVLGAWRSRMLMGLFRSGIEEDGEGGAHR